MTGPTVFRPLSNRESVSRVPLRHLPLLLLVLLVAAAPAARAQDDTDDTRDGATGAADDSADANDDRYGATVHLVDESSVITDSSTGGGDGGSLLQVDSHGEFALTVADPAISVTGGLSTDFALREVDAATTVLGADPLNLVAVGLYAYANVPLPDDPGTDVIFGGGLTASFEINAPVFRDTLSGWAFAGVALRPSPELSLRFGVSVFASLRETGLWPLVYVDWRFANHWRLRSDGWSLELAAEPSPSLWVGLTGGYRSAEFRQTSDFAPAARGIWVEHSARIALTLNVAVGVLTIHVEAGAQVWHEIRLLDESATRFDTVRVEPAAYLMARLELHLR